MRGRRNGPARRKLVKIGCHKIRHHVTGGENNLPGLDHVTIVEFDHDPLPAVVVILRVRVIDHRAIADCSIQQCLTQQQRVRICGSDRVDRSLSIEAELFQQSQMVQILAGQSGAHPKIMFSLQLSGADLTSRQIKRTPVPQTAG